MYAAKKYMIETLIVKCSEFLAQSIDVDNVCILLDQSFLFEEKGLKTRSLSFIEDNIEEVIEKENFLELSYESLLCIVKSDDLCIAELGLIQAVMRWADAQCQRHLTEASKDNRRRVLKDILDQLRFSSLTTETFVKFYESSDVLKADEIVTIFTSKHSATSDKLKLEERGSLKKWVDLIDVNQSHSVVNQSHFQFAIQCNNAIKIYALKVSFSNTSNGSPIDMAININGMNNTSNVLYCIELGREFVLDKPVLIKGGSINIGIYFTCKPRPTYNDDNMKFPPPSFSTYVYPLKSTVESRGTTFIQEGKTPLMAIKFERLYE